MGTHTGHTEQGMAIHAEIVIAYFAMASIILCWTGIICLSLATLAVV